MVYLDKNIIVSTSDTREFGYAFTEFGNFTLNLIITDPAGNSRNSTKQILVRDQPVAFEPPTIDKEKDPYMLYYILAGVVLLIILIIIIVVAVARRRDYDEVDSEWEDEEDLDEYDDIEDDDGDELDWDDDDEEW